MKTLRPTSWRLPLTILCLGIIAVALGVDRPGLALTDGRLDPVPGDLDTLLERALESNPEILVKEAALTEAIADLNRTRLAITQDVIRLYFDREEAQQVIRSMHGRMQRLNSLHKQGSVGSEDLEQASIELARAEGGLARVEAELRYSMGSGAGAIDRAGILASLARPERGAPQKVESDHDFEPSRRPIPEEMRKKIDTLRLQASFEGESLPEVLSFIATATGINIVLDRDVVEEEWEVTLRLQGEVSVRQLFQALSDTYYLNFFFRDYGVYVTEDETWSVELPRIPERER